MREPDTAKACIRRKLEDLHEIVRKRVDIKLLGNEWISSQTKTWYDQKARKVRFSVGQKIWLYNSRRIKERAPKE